MTVFKCASQQIINGKIVTVLNKKSKSNTHLHDIAVFLLEDAVDQLAIVSATLGKWFSYP